MTAETLSLSPDLLALWVKFLRESINWSQEALAEAAGVNVRTVQRVENGESSNATTRRCLARGFGYDDYDIFEGPAFAENVRGILSSAQEVNKQAFEQRFPDHTPVKVRPVTGGADLAALVDQAAATLLHCDDGAPRPAQEMAAGMFDLMRDLVDVWNDIPFTERLTYKDKLGRFQKEIEGFGLRLYSGLRHTNMVGANWIDKTPHPMAIGYVTIVPKEKVIEQMMVSKQLS